MMYREAQVYAWVNVYWKSRGRKEEGTGRRGDKDFSPLRKVKGYVLIAVCSLPPPPPPAGGFRGWDPWACHVSFSTGQLSKQWIPSSNEKKKKSLGLFNDLNSSKYFGLFLICFLFHLNKWGGTEGEVENELKNEATDQSRAEQKGVLAWIFE